MGHDSADERPPFRSDDPDRLDRWYAEHLGVTDTWTVRFEVADLDAAVARLRGAGVDVELAPEHGAGGRYAELRDPEGNPVQLWQPPSGSGHDGAYIYAIDDEVPDGAPQQDTSTRRRIPAWLPLVLVAVVAGAFVLAFGPDTEGSSVATPPSSAAPDTSTTSATSVTATSEDPGPVRVTELGHPLLGVRGDWEVFVHGADEVVRIELDSGTITRTAVPSLGTGPVSLIAGPEGVLLSPLGAGPTYLVEDGQPARQVPGTSHGGTRVFPGPEPDEVWVSSFGPGRRTVRAKTFDGRTTGQELSLPAHARHVVGSGARGNVLVSGAGGIYVAGFDQFHRVTTGAVLATGPTRFLVLECDERARCSTLVVDRSTGTRHVLNSDVEFSFGRHGLVAPDGSFAAVGKYSAAGPPKLRLINLATGESYLPDLRVNSSFREGGMAWSPNGRRLFVVTPQGELVVLNPVTRRIRTLGLALPAIEHIAIRPT